MSPHPVCLRLRAEQLEQRALLAVSSPQTAPLDVKLDQIEFRTIDGSLNNPDTPQQGAADTRVIRFGYPARYPDGHGDAIDVAGRPNARDISNAIHAQSASVLNDRHLTDWVFQWGQFLTHDLDLTINGSEFNVLSTGTTGPVPAIAAWVQIAPRIDTATHPHIGKRNSYITNSPSVHRI